MKQAIVGNFDQELKNWKLTTAKFAKLIQMYGSENWSTSLPFQIHLIKKIERI